MRAVILANGDFPTNPDLIEKLRDADFLVVCDGAVRHLRKLGIKPQAVVGDLDSISEEDREYYSEIIVHISEQETNDLSKAFYHAKSKGFSKFLILGATGRREDHALANIGLLQKFLDDSDVVEMESDFGVFSVHRTPFTLSSQKGQQVSIFCLDFNVALTSAGLRYPLRDLKLSSMETGTLNEAEGDSFSLSADRIAKVIIYRVSNGKR